MMRLEQVACEDVRMGRPATGETPAHAVRVPTDVWKPAIRAARASGTDLAKVIVAFLRWYLRQPGAKLPARPDRSAHDRAA